MREWTTSFDTVSFTLHESEMMWEPETRESMYLDAVESALEVCPSGLGEDDVRQIVKAAFREGWNYASSDNVSLWIHFHDEETGEVQVEFAMYCRGPRGVLLGPMPDFGSSGEPLSPELYHALAALPRDDEKDVNPVGGWGGLPEGLWDELSAVEQEIVMAFRSGVLGMDINPFMVTLFDYAYEKTFGEGE